MIHFEERRPQQQTRRSKRWSTCNLVLVDMISSRPAEEEPTWRGGWSGSTKTKKANRKKEAAAAAAAKAATAAPPKTNRIEVTPEYKSGLYRNVYWMHPNMAITRESRGQEEFVGEYTFYQAVNANVIVNFFPGLDYVYEHAKLRFAHTAHTPPACRAPSKTSDDYLRKNMDTLLKKIDILAFKQTILDSRPPN